MWNVEIINRGVGSDIGTLPSLLKAGDCLLEIGFGCHMAYGPGASAQLWPKLYPEAKIHMVDINKHCVEKMGHEFLARQNYTVHIADQGKVADLERLKDDVLENCSQLSVIIDDGSHRSSDIIASFHSLYPLLKPGGRHFIEDIGWSSYHVLQGRISFKYKDLYDTVPEDGLEYPGISIHFVASFLAFLFRRGVQGLGEQPYSSLEAVQCRKNICDKPLVEKKTHWLALLETERLSATQVRYPSILIPTLKNCSQVRYQIPENVVFRRVPDTATGPAAVEVVDVD
eukprot:symbB.v1.2.029474.t1/scaffold3197.1/size61477/2